MHLVEENHPLHGAGLCFLCETAISRPAQAVVNTGYVFDPPFQSPLTGEKYICQGCAETLGHTVGMVRNSDVAKAKVALDQAKLKLQAVSQGVQSLTGTLNEQAGGLLDLPVLDVPDAVTETKEKKSVTAKKSVPAGK